MSSQPRFPEAHDTPDTSTLSPGSMRPELGLTQYCLGAVVLTLNATGEECGLWMRSARFTRTVRGPAGVKAEESGLCERLLAYGSGDQL